MSFSSNNNIPARFRARLLEPSPPSTTSSRGPRVGTGRFPPSLLHAKLGLAIGAASWTGATGPEELEAPPVKGLFLCLLYIHFMHSFLAEVQGFLLPLPQAVCRASSSRFHQIALLHASECVIVPRPSQRGQPGVTPCSSTHL